MASSSESSAAQSQSQPTMGATQDSTATVQQEPQPINEARAAVFEKFRDFDVADTYKKDIESATDVKTTNFAVRFNVETSKIAIGLDEKDIKVLLDDQAAQAHQGNKEGRTVTWINLWSPLMNYTIVRRIANQYHFSTRLQATIIGWDEARRQTSERRRKKKAPRCAVPEDVRDPTQKSRRIYRRSLDPEKGIRYDDQTAKDIADIARTLRLGPYKEEDLDLYELLQDQYNYTTIDHGPNFICIGANWLHHRPCQEEKDRGKESIYSDTTGLTPPKHWAWYILTSDGTVISIHETPTYEFPRRRKFDEADKNNWKRQELINMRKNTKDLLNQLSFPGMQDYQHSVSSQKGVRSDLVDVKLGGSRPHARGTIKGDSLAVEGPANLFFYLFEDYTAAIAILPRSSDILAQLTHDVLHITDRRNRDKDNSGIIRLIYARGKDLRQLKHLFESYEKLIASIMELGVDTNGDPSTSPKNRDVKLSQTAYDRFERLSVRMRLLMLDTIEEALAEKASLSDTYFNLVSQNDSHATSKLNKNASLLAKLSVFFLPISFMTSYFSIQIPELTDGYTGTTYWVAFAVIAALSFMSLFFFSRLLVFVGDTLDEKMHAFQKQIGRGFVWIGEKMSLTRDPEAEGERDGDDEYDNGKELADR